MLSHTRLKKLSLVVPLLLCWVVLQAQAPFTLEQVRAAARTNYPEFKQKEISRQGYELELQKLRTLIYPKLNFGMQASWQSAVTSIPENIIPDFKAQPRDQYKAFIDVNQVVWDGGIMVRQLELKDAQQQVEQQKIEVSLQKVQEQVDLMFFSGLLLQAQLEQLGLVKTTIENKLTQVRGAISNGVMLESNAWLLEAELVKNSQQQTEIKAQQQSLTRMMAEYTGLPISPESSFETPKGRELDSKSATNHRAELQLFSLQNRAVDLGIAAVDAKYRPRITAFSQLGYGRPGLNMLDTQFRPWAVVGARLSWDIYDWGAGKKEKETLGLQKELVRMQREAFERQTKIGMIQVEEELDKLKKLLQQDEDMIRLRGKIKDIASVQLESGVITATEYLDRLNEETGARLAMRLHEIQVLMTQAKFGYITGNN